MVCPENEKFLGMRVTEAAEKFGFEDAAALAAYLMHSEDGKTAIINMSMSQDDIDTVARLPWSNIISDAIYAKTDTPHPRILVFGVSRGKTNRAGNLREKQNG